MPAPTVSVTVDLSTTGGEALAGITVRARLDVNEVYEEIVISQPVEGVTDADGVVVLDLFPNAPSPTGLGTQGSTYRFTATVPGGRGLNVNARVPNEDCRLENILVGDEIGELTDAELALLQAQSAVTTAASSAAAASSSASDAGDSASAAATSATAAAGSATAAATSATAAAASATSAASSASSANVSAVAAASSEAQAAAIVLGSFVQDGADAVVRTFTSKARDFVSVFDFMTEAEIADVEAGTALVDVSEAIRNAIASFGTPLDQTYYSPAGTVYFPPGLYYCGSEISIRRVVNLIGATSGNLGNWYGATTLEFPADSHGLKFESLTSAGGDQKGSDSSMVQGITLRQKAGGVTGDGIRAHSRVTIKDCGIWDFGGNGISIRATGSAPAGDDFGNANCFHIEYTTCVNNGASGIFVDGADANAGTVIGCDCHNNGAWGFHDSSFLGNTFIGNHASTNVSGGYFSDNVTARTVFIGNYNELGDPPSKMSNSSSVSLGGLMGPGWDATNAGMVLAEGELQNVGFTNFPFLGIGTGTVTTGGATVGGLAVYSKLGFTNARYGLGFKTADNGSLACVFANAADATVGDITVTGVGTTYNTTSDYRLKENVQPMTGALAKLARLKPVTYTWKQSGEAAQGFIAHELQEVFPEAVTGAKDAVREVDVFEEADEDVIYKDRVMGTKKVQKKTGTTTVPAYQGMDTSLVVATLVAGLQELKAEFDAYRALHP